MAGLFCLQIMGGLTTALLRFIADHRNNESSCRANIWLFS